jgi:hypothetical protein
MTLSMQDRKAQIEEADTLCLRLFDTWCETRSLTPLAYLMHGWPLRNTGIDRLRRLQETLKDLRAYHEDQLDSEALSMLDALFVCLDAVIDRSQPPVALRLAG